MLKLTKIIISLLLILVFYTYLSLAGVDEEGKLTDLKDNAVPKKVSIIPLIGMIDGGLYSSIERRVGIAKEKGTNLIIFEIDTFGGSLGPAFEISEYINGLKNIKTIAFIPTKAISAGSLIAISCSEIYMAPESELGDCEPIVPSSDGGYKTVGEKIQTVLRTKFRKFAEKNGYPVLLAESMVTKEIEVYFIITDEKPEGYFVSSRDLKEMPENEKKKIKSKKLIIEEGKLLTMHAKEALELKFAKEIVDDRKALLEKLGVDQSMVTLIETNWSEEMVRLLSKISPILLGIGLIAVYMEFKAPGFGLPGIVGILCLTTVFLSKYLVGLAEMPEIIVFFVGIALVAVEILVIPGFGIAGITGIIMILVGMVLSFQDFTLPRTPYDSDVFTANIFTIMCSLIGSGVGIFLVFKYMPGIPMFNRLILTASEISREGFVVPPQPSGEIDLIGKNGKAATILHPTGKVEVSDKIFDVITDGEYVSKGQTVEIIEVRGNIIVVRAVQ